MYDENKFGQYLIGKKIITTAQLEEALKRQKALGLPLGEVLINLRFVSEHIIMEPISKEMGVEYMNIAENNYQILDPALARVLPLEICQKFKVLPIYQFLDEDTREITVAMANPRMQEAIDEIRKITDCEVTPVLSHTAAIEGGIAKLFAIKQEKMEKIDITKTDAVSLVDDILKRAVAVGASDIHIEPHAKEAYVRFRVDGVMEVSGGYPLSFHSSVASRIKIIASENNSLMRIEERRLPQDGAFSRKVIGHAVDCRVSTLPTLFGEKVVMRIFDKDKAAYIGRIRDMRMSPRMELKYRRCVRQPSGINIVTGPTGSGKTTTLHAVINEISSPGINIQTVEDPVEHQATGYVNQSALMPQAGYTYSKALRAIMRQDPDVILIGEIRDLETAEIAVQAALTGHRVFSTLHTEDAAGSIARLVDIGVENFLVSSTLVSAVNQRLVRKICNNCAVEYTPTRVEMIDIGLEPATVDEILAGADRFNLRRGTGCTHCRNTGYSGRQGVYELITINPRIRNIIQSNKTSEDIMCAARESDNINMLFEEGLRLFLEGVTSLGELQNLPRGDYKLKSVDNIMKDAMMQ